MNSLTPNPTPSLDRRVRHLRFACQDAAHARRARILFEDALRTASIDDAGRLILVRRLDLGPVPLRATATAWSLRIEQRLSSIPTSLISAHSPAAANAPAVYFTSTTEPWFLAAERAARGIPGNEWFWPLALPEWRVGQPASVTLAQAFRALATRPDGLVLTVYLGGQLAARGVLPALLSVLTPELLAALPAAPREPEPANDSSRSRAFSPSPAPTPETAPHPHPPASLARFAQAWGREDPRTRWLATVLSMPAVAPGIQIPLTSLSALALPSSAQVAATVAALYFPPSRPSNSPIPPPAKPAAPDSHPPGAPTSPSPKPGTPSPTPPAAPDRRATVGGGLFFLLPLLHHVGLPAHLDTLPVTSRASYVSQLLHLALRHARIPAGDPLHELFPASSLPFARSPASFLLAAARLARRLELPLRALIRRPALFSVTPTHLDLFFRPGDADLRIRRAALDLDPGWLPWLGLVVHFHYTRED